MIRLKEKLSKAGNQRGSALVATLAAMIAVTSLGTAVTFGVTSNIRQSDRDRNVKRALAAAEAGAQEAAYRMNMLQPTDSSPCVTVSGGLLTRSAAPGPGQWCSVETVSVGSNATATYQISPYSVSGGLVTRSIVSTGTVNGVGRRIFVTSSANTGAPLFDAYGMSSDETLTLWGNANISGAARSNANFVMSGNAKVCGTPGNATPGPGFGVSLSGNAQVCGSQAPAAAPFPLTAVDQGNAPTNNDNGRLALGGADTKGFSGNWSSYWDASTRQLTLSGNTELTLSGHTYSFCKLNLSGSSHLTIAANTTVRIFVDSTSNCHMEANATQLWWSGNSKVINTDLDPTHLQIYMVGGTDQTANVARLEGNTTVTQMTLYAPNTNLNISGNGAAYTGAVVANRINVSGNGANVNFDSRVQNITQTTVGVYRTQRFVECTPANTGNSPDSGC